MNNKSFDSHLHDKLHLEKYNYSSFSHKLKYIANKRNVIYTSEQTSFEQWFKSIERDSIIQQICRHIPLHCY